MTKHAYLSASSSHRWISCPPSAKLCAEIPDVSTSYAQQGTDAHSLCEHLVLTALGRESEDPVKNLQYYDQEMQTCAESYRDFVMEQVVLTKDICPDPCICIEQKLDYSRWVPEGFGTGDCVIVADGILQIIDFKYGLGVVVSAEKNPQLLCYGLGAISAFDDLYDIKDVLLTVYQPRRQNVDTWEISKEDLLAWAEETLAPRAKLAYSGEGEFAAGDHCRFCKVRATCRTRAIQALEVTKYNFAAGSLLTTDEITDILPLISSIKSWTSDIEEYALKQALSGVHFHGWKVVEGRSNRKYSDEQKVADVVMKAGYEPYEKKLLGITSMTKQLGQKKFDELLKGLIVKPQGKPVLVPATDKRPDFNTAAEDFNDSEENSKDDS